MKNVPSQPSDDDLTAELARLVIQKAAPEELLVFDEVYDEYRSDPKSLLRPKDHEEAVGFGIEVAMLTPYVLAVAGPIIQYLLSLAADATKQEATPILRGWVRRALRRDGETSDQRPLGERTSDLTPREMRQLHEVAYDRAKSVGLPQERAILLADAIVGSIATGRP